MAEDSLQRHTLRAGGTRLCRIDLRKDLDEDDTLSSAVVTEISSTDLTFGTVVVGVSAKFVLNESVPALKWIEFELSGHLAATGTYRMKVTFSTAGGALDVPCKEDFVFDVIS